MTKEVPRTSVLRDEELIARLQNSKGWPTLGNAAADRIELLATTNEQLVATNEALSISNATLIAERGETMQLIETLSNMNGGLSRDMYRTKLLLAKVVEALEMYACDPECADGKCYDTGDSCGQFATATLAEIKSGVATTPYGLEGESHE